MARIDAILQHVAVAALCALTLREERWLGHEAAGRSLGMLRASDAVPELIAAAWLADTRAAAIFALSRIADARAVEVLFSALDDEADVDTRRASAQGLVAIGPATVDFVAAQVARDCADFPEPVYRHHATTILQRIGGDRALALVRSVQECCQVTAESPVVNPVRIESGKADAR